MKYYLEDHASKCVILITDNLLLATSLQTGILDCYLKITNDSELIEIVESHFSSNNSEFGITCKNFPPKIVSLKNFPYTKEKIRLAKLRKPCFERLLFNVHQYDTASYIGFSEHDEIYINYALSNQETIREYATLVGMSEDFAKKELFLLQESVFKDRFRLFTVSSMLRKKINQITQELEVKEALKLIDASFYLHGMHYE